MTTRVAIFSAKPYERPFLEAANTKYHFDLVLLNEHLDPDTGSLAAGCQVVSVFANDRLDRQTLTVLAGLGVTMLALRSAGYNHVDRIAAAELGFTVAHVPAYSPLFGRQACHGAHFGPQPQDTSGLQSCAIL